MSYDAGSIREPTLEDAAPPATAPLAPLTKRQYDREMAAISRWYQAEAMEVTDDRRLRMLEEEMSRRVDVLDARRALPGTSPARH